MLKIEFEKKEKFDILCIGAHCDDIEIGAGGTLLKIIEKYPFISISWVVFSSTKERRREAVESAGQFLRDVEIKEIIVKTWRDGFLPFNAGEVKDYFEDLKKRINPDLIFTHYQEDRHQDHRFISDLTWNTWRNHLILEYEIIKFDGDLGIPNFFVQLDEEKVQNKNRIIIEAYKSQSKKHWFDEETFLALPRIRGIESACQYAEAFYARKIFT